MDEQYKLLTINEAMVQLNMGKNKIYEMLQSGKLSGFKEGKKWLIPQKSIYEYIDNGISHINSTIN